MAQGTSTYKGLAVPLWGESNIRQATTGNDILTITQLGSTSSDYIVCRTSGGTEHFVVGSSGAVTAAAITASGEITASAGVFIPKGQYLRLSLPVTTAPTTGLTIGDLFWTQPSTIPHLGLCVSSAETIYYFTANTTTFARASTT